MAEPRLGTLRIPWPEGKRAGLLVTHGPQSLSFACQCIYRRRPTRPNHRQTTLGKWPRPQQKALGASSWKRPGGSYIVGGTWGYLGGSRGDLEGVLEATEGVLTAMLSKMALRRPRKVEYIEKHCEKHNSGSSRGVSWAHLGGCLLYTSPSPRDRG